MTLKKRLFSFFTAVLLVINIAVLAGCNNLNVQPGPAVPGPVTELKARAGDGKVTLSWKNPKAEGFVSAKVFRETDEIQEFTKKETFCEISGLTNGREYSFKVKAVFKDDEGAEKSFDSAIVKATPKAFSSLSSVEFAENLVVGWNLGNTLDATSNWTKDTETAWGMPMTTEAMIKAVHAKGFETIRIPVSWHNHVSGADYTVDSSWMKRVKEVVDWAIDDGMYVILNIHHDNFSEEEMNSNSGFCLSKDSIIQAKSKKYIEDVWTQIATTFADYDEHLVFEVLNEPRDIGGKVWGNEWWIGGASGVEVCKVITDYEQAAIDVIRDIPGNENRFIMVPGYAASASDIGMLDCYTMPKDEKANDKLLLSGHAYTPYPFAMKDMVDTVFDSEDKDILDDMFAKLNTKYISKGIGIVMGEASASDKDNLEERIKWAKYYFGKAKQYHIPVVLWDNMVLYKNSHDPAESHGYFDRKNLKWFTPDLVDAMIEAAGGISGDDNGNSQNPPADPAPFEAVTIFDPETATAPAGMEIVAVGDKKFLKLTVNGYNTSFQIAPVDCNGATTFSVECFVEDDTLPYQVTIGIKDSEWKDISGPVLNPLKSTVTKITGEIATSGESVSETKICELIQPMAVNPADWEEVNGVVLYLGKIIAE